MIIGVTGRIATGKTSVADIFVLNDFFRIDADIVYRELKKTSDTMNQEILLRFKSLDNAEILDKIKNDETALKDLNSITHKFVINKIDELITLNRKKNIILDVAVPVKRGFLDISDYIIVTNCRKTTQVKRVLKRANENTEGANIKVNMQNDEYYYRNLGDMVIETDDLNLEDLTKIIEKEFNL